jgi:signal transduction histidine kinase
MTDAPKARILVVDDNQATRYTVARVLRNHGYHVTEGDCGADALRLVEGHDLAILDVRLPDMIGFEISQRLKADPRTAHISILHLSASYTTPDAQALGLESGADAYLTQPLEPQVLLATVHALLRLRTAERRVHDLLVAERELTTQLERAVRLREEFLAIASHDLRSPLQALQLRVTTLGLRIRAEQPEAIVRDLPGALDAMKRQLDRTVQLLNDLLDVTHIAAGALSIHPVESDLAAIATEAAARFRDQLTEAGAKLSVKAPEPVYGMWDRLRIEQIVTNLVSNAVKYGAKKDVDVEVTAHDGIATIAVRDHGIGIALEDQKRIFNRFERVSSSAKREQSSGLGLWIVSRLVEILGGTTAVSSRPGRGSTFTVELPLAGPPASRDPKS